MKKILLSITIFISLNSLAQSANDSAYTKALALQARLTAIFAPYANNSGNDSLFTYFIKLRAAQHSNFVTGTTTITIDTIPTVELANLYNYVLGLPGGLGFTALVTTQLSAARTANPYLQKLCTDIDNAWNARAAQMLIDGYKLERGK